MLTGKHIFVFNDQSNSGEQIYLESKLIDQDYLEQKLVLMSYCSAAEIRFCGQITPSKLRELANQLEFFLVKNQYHGNF